MTKRQQIVQRLDELKVAVKAASGDNELIEALECAIELICGEDPFEDNDKVYGIFGDKFDKIRQKLVDRISEEIEDALEDYR